MEDLPQKPESLSTARAAHKAIKKRMFSYIAAGFGLVAGLAWNDAIKLLIDYFFPNSGTTVIAKLLYALILTIVVSIVLFYVERSLQEDEK